MGLQPHLRTLVGLPRLTRDVAGPSFPLCRPEDPMTPLSPNMALLLQGE